MRVKGLTPDEALPHTLIGGDVDGRPGHGDGPVHHGLVSGRGDAAGGELGLVVHRGQGADFFRLCPSFLHAGIHKQGNTQR